MLMWRLSVKLTLSVARPASTGSGTRTTRKQVAYWYTFGCREPVKPVVDYWPCSRFLIFGMLTTDDWGSDARELPKEKHLTSKIFTQRIERNNLTLRPLIK